MTAPKPVEQVARDADAIGYVRGLRTAADWTRAFDQDLPGFDRPSCVNLANGLTEMARHAGERLGVAIDFNEPPAPLFHDCCVHDGHGDARPSLAVLDPSGRPISADALRAQVAANVPGGLVLLAELATWARTCGDVKQAAGDVDGAMRAQWMATVLHDGHLPDDPWTDGSDLPKLCGHGVNADCECCGDDQPIGGAE